MHLMQASKQWATRPADERFWDLDELHAAVSEIRAGSRIARTPENKLRVRTEGDDLRLVGEHSEAQISHWAFGQLCTRAGAPAAYMRDLPAELAARNLNHGLESNARTGRSTKMLVYQNGSNLIRSIATDKFSPIWNVDIVDRLRNLPGDFRTPPARPARIEGERTRTATAEDARYSIQTGLGVKEGDTIAPAGLYASPEDMFVLLIDPTKVIRDGSEGGLQRGIIVQNAEVAGKLRFRMLTFYHRGVCGNHIVWNASGLTEIAVLHVGDAPERALGDIQVTVRRYADSGASEDEARIVAAQTRTIAATRDEVLDALFKRSILSRAQLDAAYTSTEEHPEDGDPNTFWGMAQGITRISQELPNMDQRLVVDQAAGKVLEMAF